MSISMEIDWTWSVVEFHVSGIFTPMTIVDAFALLSAGPQMAKLRGMVWDVREADMENLDAKGLSAGLKASHFPDNADEDFRIAAVTAPGSGQGIGAIWIEVGKAMDFADRKIFQCIDEARVWVQKSAELGGAETLRA